MGNFLTQAGSDFWDILRKKLPESFGMQWGVPEVPDMAKPVNLARSAINAYASLPTASNEDISKGVQGRVARSGLGPNVDVAKWDKENPSPNIENRSWANAKPINPAVQARAALTTPPVSPVSPALTPMVSNIPTTEEAMGRLMKNNPNMAVSYNGQAINRPGQNQGGPGEGGSTPASSGTLTSIDPTTGKEKLIESFSPTKVRQWFETRPRDTDGEQIGEVREKLLGMLDRFQSERGRSKGFRTVKEDDIKLMSESLARLESGDTGRKQLDVTARGQDINAQSHKESLGPALARENLNALKAPGEMALTAAQTRKFQEPSTIQGYSGAEHITMERNRDTGKWDTVTRGEGPRTNQEEGSLLKTQSGLILKQYENALDTLSGKGSLTASDDEKKAAEQTIKSINAKTGGQGPRLNPGERIVSNKNGKRVVVNKNNIIVRELD